MVLDIKNVGKIEHATVNFDGITVVAGPNSSGKSTISKSLYLMNLANEEARLQGSREKVRSIRKYVNDLLQSLPEFKEKSFEEQNEIKNDFVKEIRLGSDGFKALEKVSGKHQLFDSEEELRKYVEYLKTNNKSYIQNDADYYIKYAVQKMIDEIFKGQLNRMNCDEISELECSSLNSNLILKADNSRVNSYVGNLGFHEDRKTIYISTSDFVDTMDSIRNVRQIELMNGGAVMNRRLAQMLLKTDRRNLTAEEYERCEEQRKIFIQMLMDVVNGNIEVADGRLQYYDNDCQSNIEFTNMASGMKIFLILKRLIENGILLEKVNLIIDEPEANLHPEWQLKLAELLVLLYKNLDVRVYINSHSPYFVRAIEYYSNQYDIMDNVNFYTMEEIGYDGAYTAKEVTENVDIIYKHLSKPLSDVM